MPKLNQIIAIEKGIKTKNYAAVTELHKLSGKKELFNGHARRYSPLGEDPTSPAGETLPDEDKKVQESCKANLKKAADLLGEMFNLSAAREYGNCSAKADIVVDEKVILKDVPVSYLLYLEKQLVDLHTFIKSLPTLDAGENWRYDSAQDRWASDSSQSARTKKLTRPFVLYEATDKHPAQVKEVSEDIRVGTWTTTKYSSALETRAQNELIGRVEKLQVAVKFAREQANELAVEKKDVAKAIFSYVLGE
jgi:hypothetical protein